VVKTNLRYTYLAKGRYWRFRHRLVGDVPLPGKPGEEEFHQRYAEMLAKISSSAQQPDRKSFTWLIAEYRKSAEFAALADTTQSDYFRTLDLIKEELGDQPFRFTTRKMIKEVRDSHAAHGRKAHKIKQMVSRLYSWADEEDLIPAGLNPAAGIKRLKYKEEAITPWSEEEIDLFVAYAPAYIATPVLLALYTGQRASDVVTMTWKQALGNTVRVKQMKTGEPLDIACHPKLREHIDKLRLQKGKGVVIALSIEGRSFSAHGLAQALAREIVKIPDMPHRTMHGLRYAAAARLEDAGCTITEIVSIIGHRTYQMGMKYAGQRKASQRAMQKQEKNA
jgi:integrase